MPASASGQVAETESFAFAPDENAPLPLHTKDRHPMQHLEFRSGAGDFTFDAQVVVEKLGGGIASEIAKLAPDADRGQWKVNLGTAVDSPVMTNHDADHGVCAAAADLSKAGSGGIDLIRMPSST